MSAEQLSLLEHVTGELLAAGVSSLLVVVDAEQRSVTRVKGKARWLIAALPIVVSTLDRAVATTDAALGICTCDACEAARRQAK